MFEVKASEHHWPGTNTLAYLPRGRETKEKTFYEIDTWPCVVAILASFAGLDKGLEPRPEQDVSEFYCGVI